MLETLTKKLKSDRSNLEHRIRQINDGVVADGVCNKLLVSIYEDEIYKIDTYLSKIDIITYK